MQLRRSNLWRSGALCLATMLPITACGDDEPEEMPIEMPGDPGPMPGPDPDLDTDGDGLTDKDEMERYGTSIVSDDTDGDGFSDFEEIVEKAFDPETNNFQFNPLIADAPELKITMTSAPDVYLLYTEGTETTQTVGTERTESTASIDTRSWGGSNTRSVEMTHTAGVEVSVEHEFGLLGGTTVSGSLSYEFSHSTTNEQSTNWSDEQSTENSEALARIEETEESASVTTTGGALVMTLTVENPSNIAYVLENLTLTAFVNNPADPLQLASVGNLIFTSGSLDVFPATVLQPGERSNPLNFAADLDLPTAKSVLADSKNLIVAPATYLLQGNGDLNFQLAATTINARTAQVIIDYGIDESQENYRIATTATQDGEGITFAQAFDDILKIPYEHGTEPWIFGKEADTRSSFTGITSIRAAGMDAERAEYWIVAHSYPTQNGASSQTDYYNLILADYDLRTLILRKGHTLHLVRVQDPDRDGLGSRSELVYGTDPNNPDTDGDGCMDSLEAGGWEIEFEGETLRVFPSPLIADTDADGISDCAEYEATPRTHPTYRDPNEAPVVESLSAQPGQGLSADLTIAFADPDRDDRVESLRIDWGDGSAVQTVAVPEGRTQMTISHEYGRLGSFRISVVASDGTDESAAATTTYDVQIPTNELLAHYPLNGDATDASGNGNDAYYRVGAFGADRFGFAEKAADLENGNNSGSLGIVASPHLGMTRSFTIAVWTSVDSNGNGERIAGQGNWFNLYFSSSRRVGFGIMDGLDPDADEVQLRSSVNHPDDVWTLYVGVVELSSNRTTMRLYQGAYGGTGMQEVASQTVNEIYNNPGSCRFYAGHLTDGNLCTGTNADEFSQYPGLVDDVRVYDRALSAPEINALFLEPAN